MNFIHLQPGGVLPNSKYLHRGDPMVLLEELKTTTASSHPLHTLLIDRHAKNEFVLGIKASYRKFSRLENKEGILRIQGHLPIE